MTFNKNWWHIRDLCIWFEEYHIQSILSYSAELYICISKYPSTNIGHYWSIYIRISFSDYAEICAIRAGKTKRRRTSLFSERGHLYKCVGFSFMYRVNILDFSKVSAIRIFLHCFFFKLLNLFGFRSIISVIYRYNILILLEKYWERRSACTVGVSSLAYEGRL